MLRPPPFPISIDGLTSDTLSEGLGIEVANFSPSRIGADRGMLGEIFLLDLTYAVGVAGPDRVVAKFAALRDGSLASAQRSGSHERELRCFDELLSDTPVSAPVNYGTWYDPETAHFLLLQSAIDADHGVDQVEGISIEDSKLVLSETAKLHARWWNDPTLADRSWLPRLDSDQRVHNLTSLAAAGWAPLVEALDDDLTDHQRSLGAQLPARLEAALRYVASLPSTLIHSDLRADNLLFAPDHSGVTVVDWQGCGLGPPGFDLAYHLTQSLTIDDRRQHEDELLDFYGDQLAAAGLHLSASDVRAGYAESLIFGLAVACALPLISDPKEDRSRLLMSAFTSRTLAAMEDHNQLWET